MLSPNIVETSEDIAAAYAQFLAVNSFSHSAGRIVVSPLSPDPDWLPTLRQRIATLAQVSAQWRLDYPNVVATYLLPFTNYSATFGAFAKLSPKFGNDVSVWT